MLTFDYVGAHKILASRRENPACLSYYEKRVGGLSKPSKMPWYGWSISATECKTGSALRDVPGSVCSKCYALKGRYAFPNVRKALERRLQMYRQHPAKWAAYMVLLLEGKANGNEQHFRWFDSGDVQDFEMIQAFVWIAQQLPHIKFWLPSKEYALMNKDHVKDLVSTAPNLTVRISAPMVGQVSHVDGYCSSSVGRGQGEQCPAKFNEGKCGRCRSCWDKRVTNVDYPEH